MGRRRLQRVGWRVLYWRGMQGRHASAAGADRYLCVMVQRVYML